MAAVSSPRSALARPMLVHSVNSTSV